nr:hypothetical protein CFP56_65413 [Quercus suber]
MLVSELIDKNTGQWNRQKVHELFAPSTRCEILAIPLNALHRRDELEWKENRARSFSVKDAYQVALRLLHHDGAEHSNARIDGKPESTSHLLWECPLARNMWAISKGRVQKCSNQVQDFFQLFQMLKGKLTKIELERWATTTWAIWNARNKYYFEKVQVQPRSIMDQATGILEDYQRLAASQNTIDVVP